MSIEKIEHIISNNVMNGVSSEVQTYLDVAIEYIGIPVGQFCAKFLYSIYMHFTFFNLMIFLIKCVPTGIYMHKFLKSIYATSRERMKQKQLELEDIELQVQIVNTKFKLRDAEFAERGELLRRKVEQLRKVRKRVQEIIATDDELRNSIHSSALWETEQNYNFNSSAEEESKFLVELLKELKCDQVSSPETGTEKMSCDENSVEPISAENSVYSSAHDVDTKQDYNVKIVKVTNVYKVAYLRHFIKQKRLRRANRQASLRKKMDSIKKLLDDWQKTLKMVINNKIVHYDPQHMQYASQEAMGDYLKPKFNNSSGSDSDFINGAESCRDDYCVSWSQNQYRPMYNNDDYNANIEVTHECYDLEECFNNYNIHEERCECGAPAGILFVVPEETRSQVEIEEIKRDIE